MDTVRHHDRVPTGTAVIDGTRQPKQIQRRPGDPFSFPEFGAGVTGVRQADLERLKLETMRRRGLEELFGMIRYHTSRAVKGYKGKEMDDFVRDISKDVRFLAEQGIHFHLPEESEGRDGWVRFVKSLEAISPQVYAGTYVFEGNYRLSPGGLYAQEPYRQAWTFEGMMAQRAPGFNLKNASYTTNWQSLWNAFRRVDRSLTKDQPEAYIRKLHKRVVPQLTPALAQIFSMHSEQIVRGMKDLRRQVDLVIGESAILSAEQTVALGALRIGQFHNLTDRVDRLQDGYDRLCPMIEVVSHIVERAMQTLDLGVTIPGKYELRTDVVDNYFLQMYGVDRMMTRV